MKPGRSTPTSNWATTFAAAHDYVSFLKPAWLQKVSESCALEDI
jgi:hypothetical protein